MDPSKGADFKPLDKKTNYVKRCVGIAGDTLEVRDGYVYINGKQNILPDRAKLQFYNKVYSSKGLSTKKLLRYTNKEFERKFIINFTNQNQFDKVMNNNIKSTQKLCNLCIPHMKEKNDGSIIIISSIAAIKGSPILGAYNISKAADVMIVKNIAAEFGQFNIRANSIAPGLIKTDFAKGLWENPDILKSVLTTTPMKRIGEADEIAGVAVMLASKAGSYINGETIVVDGGTTIA